MKSKILIVDDEKLMRVSLEDKLIKDHKQCKGCHQKEKKGPTKCDDCHKK